MRRLNTTTIFAISAFAFASGPANAQAAANVVTIDNQRSGNGVAVGDYYSQVLLRTQDLTPPADDRGNRDFGKALLNAFGLGRKTRSITISATISVGNEQMPETPLITYTFDGSRRYTGTSVLSEHTSPRWRLAANEQIRVELAYRYTETSTYDPQALRSGIAGLIPSTMVVNAMSLPLIGGVSDLATGVLQTAGEREVVASRVVNLQPHGGRAGYQSVDIALTLPNGAPLGKISADVLVSPSINRPSYLPTNVMEGDLVARDAENGTEMIVQVGGVPVRPLDRIRALSEYQRLNSNPSPQSVRTFCTEADETLIPFELTRFDEIGVLYQALRDADFRPGEYHETANTWIRDCLTNESDVTFLANSRQISTEPGIPPVVEDPDPLAATRWPIELKNAMGCHMRREISSWCSRNAPDELATLNTALAELVRIGIVELPSFDNSAIPVGRMLQRTALLALLQDSVDQFACYELGFVVTEAGSPYFMNVTYEDAKINSVELVRAPDGAAQCLLG